MLMNGGSNIYLSPPSHGKTNCKILKEKKTASYIQIIRTENDFYRLLEAAKILLMAAMVEAMTAVHLEAALEVVREVAVTVMVDLAVNRAAGHEAVKMVEFPVDVAEEVEMLVDAMEEAELPVAREEMAVHTATIR